jgi:hypothetical protein
LFGLIFEVQLKAIIQICGRTVAEGTSFGACGELRLISVSQYIVSSPVLGLSLLSRRASSNRELKVPFLLDS